MKTVPPEIFTTWANMHRRCYYTKDQAFRHYGGRGIRVCPRWSSLAAFFRDMGPRPSSRHSLERIDNDGHYAPANCRWATQREQTRNVRRNRSVTYGGRTQCVTAWAEELGIGAITLTKRLNAGWPVEQAFTTPARRPEGAGRVMQRNTTALCRQAGIPVATFYARLYAGMSEHDALTTPRRPYQKEPKSSSQ